MFNVIKVSPLPHLLINFHGSYNFAVAVFVFLTLDVRDLQCFSDALKVGLLVFLELWLRTYPLICGSG